MKKANKQNKNLFYLFTLEGGKDRFVEDLQYSLPTSRKPGEWMPVRKPAPINDKHRYGPGYKKLAYVVFNKDALDINFLGAECYLVEAKGKNLKASKYLRDGLFSFKQVRLIKKVKSYNRTNLILHAADCTERVIKQYACGYKWKEERAHKMLAVIRDYARGKSTKRKLTYAGKLLTIPEKIFPPGAKREATMSFMNLFSACRELDNQDGYDFAVDIEQVRLAAVRASNHKTKERQWQADKLNSLLAA